MLVAGPLFAGNLAGRASRLGRELDSKVEVEMERNDKMPVAKDSLRQLIMDEVDRVLIQNNLSQLRKTVMGSMHHSSEFKHLKTTPAAQPQAEVRSASASSWRFWVGLLATAMLVSVLGVKAIDHVHHQQRLVEQPYHKRGSQAERVRIRRSGKHAAKPAEWKTPQSKTVKARRVKGQERRP